MIGILIIVIVALIVIWGIRTVNGFKRKEIRVEESASGIEVALVKRYDMLTKMLDVAKNYAQYEQETQFKTISLRKGMSINDMNKASQTMDKLSNDISLTAEAYPELRSSEVFAELQSGIRDAEEHLQAARRLYNASVRDFNTSIELFQASILAGGRMPKDFFEADGNKKEDIKMSF